MRIEIEKMVEALLKVERENILNDCYDIAMEINNDITGDYETFINCYKDWGIDEIFMNAIEFFIDRLKDKLELDD